MTALTTVLKHHAIRNHTNEGIMICNVGNSQEGVALANTVTKQLVDRKTVLYLSGGTTPKALYATFASEEIVHPGAVGLVDERFGKKFHNNSNEKMIRETGLTRYLELKNILFYPILQFDRSHPDPLLQGEGQGLERKQTADIYDEKVRHLTMTFPSSMAILGIGVDGHISSLAPNKKDFKNPMFDQSQSNLFVSEFNDPKSFYGERVGMTFLGLSMQDMLMVLVFGEDKKEALEQMFQNGSEQEIPARFFKRPEIAEKTLFITDQNV